MFALDFDILLVTLILSTALLLLVTEKIAVDKTAMGIMAALALSGILSPA